MKRSDSLEWSAFALVTLVFIIRHATTFSWDFHSYVLNAEYWFSHGSYFEPLRPPLMPVILGLLSFVGSMRVAEYLFIILASLLFFYSTKRLASALKFDFLLFYGVSTNYFLLTKGLFNGTELLAVSFLALTVAFLIEKKNAGAVLGFMMLSRYTALRFIPLLLFSASIRLFARDILSFGVVVFPWLLYNFLTYGNWFTSIADQYANNIVFRDYLHSPLEFAHFAEVMNYFIPFVILGVILSIRDIARTKQWNSSHLIMLAITILTVHGFAGIPIKSSRYLFDLLLPVAFYSYVAINWLIGKRKINQTVAIILIALNLIIATNVIIHRTASPEPVYHSALSDLSAYSNCSIMSNAWVELNYLGRTSLDFPRQELLNTSINRGQIVVMFRNTGEPDYVHNSTFMQQFPTKKSTPAYDILGTGCVPITSNTDTFVKKLADTIEAIHGYRTEERPCQLLLKQEMLVDVCEFVNFKTSQLY